MAEQTVSDMSTSPQMATPHRANQSAAESLSADDAALIDATLQSLVTAGGADGNGKENEHATMVTGSEGIGSEADPAEEALELLQTLLFDEYRQQIKQMRGQVVQLQKMLDQLDRQIQDEEALISTITPVIASAIRTNISESREEMVDALYPIMGKLVQRSVTEAMRDLAQRIDQQMRQTLDFKSFWRRFQARLRGISDAEMAMRSALPFQVDEIFLIHKETGLLLIHLSKDGDDNDEDSDIISGMLTAITEFTQDAFGRHAEEALNEIQYGERSILLEAAHLVYLAVVINGFESSELRSDMREAMIAVEHRHASALRRYDGDTARFAESKALLAALL